MDLDALTEILEANGFEEWEVLDDVSLLSPDGNVIEWDGEGSPLIALGII